MLAVRIPDFVCDQKGFIILLEILGHLADFDKAGQALTERYQAMAVFNRSVRVLYQDTNQPALIDRNVL